MKEIYIIGGGLGGLFAGALQAKKGRKVTVLEKNATPGGGLQTFTRQVGERCEIFETGMHLLGGFREDGAVRILLKKLQIFDKLKIKSVDSNCMDEIIYLSDRKVYRIPEDKVKNAINRTDKSRENYYNYYDYYKYCKNC